MLNSFLLAIRFLILVSGHKQVALENIALRQQLAVFTREKKRPRLRNRDRLFWIALKKLWKDWRAALVFVEPETVAKASVYHPKHLRLAGSGEDSGTRRVVQTRTNKISEALFRKLGPYGLLKESLPFGQLCGGRVCASSSLRH